MKSIFIDVFVSSPILEIGFLMQNGDAHNDFASYLKSFIQFGKQILHYIKYNRALLRARQA
jgi:hypothetical protein